MAETIKFYGKLFGLGLTAVGIVLLAAFVYEASGHELRGKPAPPDIAAV